jgi:non-heme chloroperoxidase
MYPRWYGDGDQIVPYKDAALLSVKLPGHGTPKIYPGFRMLTTHADVINQDPLACSRLANGA